MTQDKNGEQETKHENQINKFFRVAVRDFANITINILDWALFIVFFLLIVMNGLTNQPLHNTTEILIFIAAIMIGLGAVKVIFGLWIQDPERKKLVGFLDLAGKIMILSGLILVVNENVLIGVVLCVSGLLSQIYFHQKISRFIIGLFRD